MVIDPSPGETFVALRQYRDYQRRMMAGQVDPVPQIHDVQYDMTFREGKRMV